MVRSTCLVALAGLACAFAAGCGDDSKPDAAKPQPAKANLEQFLMQAGEEPGFDPIESARRRSTRELTASAQHEPLARSTAAVFRLERDFARAVDLRVTAYRG